MTRYKKTTLTVELSAAQVRQFVEAVQEVRESGKQASALASRRGVTGPINQALWQLLETYGVNRLPRGGGMRPRKGDAELAKVLGLTVEEFTAARAKAKEAAQ